MNSLWSQHVRGLTPYTPGEQPPKDQFIKLNTNENPYPPAPSVLAALSAAVNADLRLYPDPEGQALRATLADYHDLDPSEVFLGNGSDEVLALTFLALLKHEQPILFPDVTYSFYPVYCALYDIAYQTVALNADFQADVDDYSRPNGGVVLPNPNAPTGSALGRSQLRRLLERCTDSVVVVDEAYVDFGAESAVPLIREFPNLLVTQTLSKSRSLAGLRVGFALGDRGLIEALNVVKNCFNSYPLDRLALVGAEAAVRDTQYFDSTRERIIASRTALARELSALDFRVLPSQANFLFVEHARLDGETLQQALREHRILVRRLGHARIGNFLRISIGTDEQCRELLRCMALILA